WKRCGDPREFVEAVWQLTEERSLSERAKREAAEWIEWSLGVVDAYDPLAVGIHCFQNASRSTGTWLPAAAAFSCNYFDLHSRNIPWVYPANPN
ncbi:MAG: hypothetical protein ACKO6B_00135, partial [Planctomycetia bacterium]